MKTGRALLVAVLAVCAPACDGCDDGGWGVDGGASWFTIEAGVVDKDGDDDGGDGDGDGDGDSEDGGASTNDGGAATSDGGASSNDGGAATGDGGGSTGDGGAATGDGGGSTGDGGGSTGDGGASTGDGGAATSDGGAATSDGGASSGSDAGVEEGDDDAGAIEGDGDVWIELNWSNAYSPQSPAWSFSATPGWGAAQWAMAGDTWPEAWDRWNNMQVVDDPIGRALEIGGGESMQIMLGLEELAGYDHASVRLWGRSRATSSSVQFDVYNPLVDCGDSATTSQDWVVHVIDVDLDQCMVIGAGVQAVRIEPTSGTLALVKVRVTLFGASF